MLERKKSHLEGTSRQKCQTSNTKKYEISYQLFNVIDPIDGFSS